MSEHAVTPGPHLDSSEAVPLLDLRGVICPINYVKARLALERLSPGDRLDLLLDAGEPLANVPRAVRDDGHRVLAIVPDGTAFRARVLRA